MNISELKVGQEKVNIEAEVTAMEEPRSFTRFGKTIRVANATINDGNGEIKLTLWNNDIDNVKIGDKVKVTNGFVNEFKGEKQLTAGKFGKTEVLGKSGNPVTEDKPKKGKKKEEKAEEECKDDCECEEGEDSENF